MTETELKFLIAKPDLSKLWTLPALREWIKDARARRSKSTYFDTPGGDLWKRGFILRIRSTDGYLIQTIKQEQSSLVDRGEWERQIEPPAKGALLQPDLAMIDDTPLADAIDESVRASLLPAFETDVERTAFAWAVGETLIEVAIDQGFIRVLGARGETLDHDDFGVDQSKIMNVIDSNSLEPEAGGKAAAAFPHPALEISELELELKQGDRQAAFVLARMLAAQAPLHLSLISKAERGQLLMAHAIGLPAKASEPRLSGDMTINAAFTAICSACLHDFMLNAAALDGADPVEAVHQGRVALRRLRAALALFRPVRRDGYARMNEQLKWLAGIFGAARDADVLRAGGEIPAFSPEGGGAPDFSQWREARRLAAHEAVRAAVQSKRWRIFLIDLCEWIEDDRLLAAPPHEGPGALIRFVRKQLKRRRDALVRPARDLANLGPVAQHQLRIMAKKLRYAAQFFAGVSGFADQTRLKRFLVCLDRLQSAFGALHDEEATRGVVEAEIRLWRSEAGHIEAAAPAAPARPAARTDERDENVEKAIKAYARLVKTNPF
ncbi:MAG: CHAD domain-containing protein [Methylocella sp.]